VIALLVLLVPFALIDSLSVFPLALIPLIAALAGRRPVAVSLAFLGGFFLSYYLIGMLLMFGFDRLFDVLADHFNRWWNSEPDLGEVLLEIIVGLVMIFSGHRLCRPSGKPEAQAPRQGGLTAGKAFGIAVLINVTGFWGALPYFGAIAQILKVDLPIAGMLGALLFYNLVFFLPLVVVLLSSLLLGARSEPMLRLLNDFLIHWGGKILLTLLMGLGFVLFIDGIGWLMDTPLFLPGAAG